MKILEKIIINFNNIVFVIISVNILFFCSILIYSGPIIHMDTITYLKAMNNFYDPMRTPIYPLILSLNKIIFENYYLYAVVCFQLLLFAVSSIYLNRITKKLGFIKHLRIIIYIFYTLSPFVNSLVLYIATESFSISLFVILVYLFVDLFNHKKYINIIYIYILTIILIFLRPAFLVLLPIVLFVNLLHLNKYFLVHNFISLLSFCSILIFLFIYSTQIKNQIGIRTISFLSIQNKGYILSDDKTYDLNRKDSITEYLKECNFKPECDDKLIKKFGYVACNNYYNLYYFSIQFLKKRIIKIFKLTFAEKYLTIVLPQIKQKPKLWNLFRWVGVPFLLFYLLIIGNLMFLYVKRKNKDLMFKFILLSTSYCILLFSTSILYADSNYGRICSTTYPLFYILIGYYLFILFKKSSNRFRLTFRKMKRHVWNNRNYK